MESNGQVGEKLPQPGDIGVVQNGKSREGRSTRSIEGGRDSPYTSPAGFALGKLLGIKLQQSIGRVGYDRMNRLIGSKVKPLECIAQYQVVAGLRRVAGRSTKTVAESLLIVDNSRSHAMLLLSSRAPTEHAHKYTKRTGRSSMSQGAVARFFAD
jgi:hypothetical protein